MAFGKLFLKFIAAFGEAVDEDLENKIFEKPDPNRPDDYNQGPIDPINDSIASINRKMSELDD